MSTIHVKFVEKEIAYSGEQLRSHWAYRSFDLLGDSAVAFVGPCDVRPEFMKDVEDLKAASRIYSEEMLHFIVEHFSCALDMAVLRQRLLMAIMAENLNRRDLKGGLARRSFSEGGRVTRSGSDLYDGKFKLTVSIASVSPVSALIHAGINISSRNTPVPTRGLADYGIEPRAFAEEVLAVYSAECEGLLRARCKVRGCE
jgi:hypothetical protein